MTTTGAYRRLLGALVMMIAIGIQSSGGMCIHAVPVATADWQGIEGRSWSGVVDSGSVVSRPWGTVAPLRKSLDQNNIKFEIHE